METQHPSFRHDISAHKNEHLAESLTELRNPSRDTRRNHGIALSVDELMREIVENRWSLSANSVQ